MKINKKDWLIVLVFFFLSLLCFYPFLSGSNIFGFKDLSRYFYPLRHLMVEQVKSGILPLWNPYLFCGYPFMASLQIGFFYPLSIIHYLLPFNLAFNYYTILHYFIAAVSAYFLMRTYSVLRPAAFLSGLVFAFSGHLLSMANMNTTLSSITWFPLVLLCFHKRKVFPLALALSCMFLGGEPTVIYTTSLVLLAYGLYFGDSLSKGIKNCLLLLAALFTMAGLTAVQLFPFIELAHFSDRLVLTKISFISSESFPIREVLNFLFPYFFGNPLDPGSYSQTFLGSGIQNWLLSPYIGFIPLFFMFCALCRIRENRRIKFWTILGAFGLLLAFGRYTFVYPLLYKILPGISYIRFPVKYLFLTVFSVAVLSGFGFDYFFRTEQFKSKKVLGGLLFLSLLCLFCGLLYPLFFSHPSVQGTFFIETLKHNISFNLQSIINLGGIILIFAAVLYLLDRKTIGERTAIFTIIFIIVADLFAANVSINKPVKASLFSANVPNISTLLSDKGLFRYCLTGRLIAHNRSLYGVDYNEALLDAKNRMADNLPVYNELYDFNGYESVLLQDYVDFNSKLNRLNLDQRLRALGELNVKYILSINPFKSRALEFVQHQKTFYGDTYLYKNRYFKERFFLKGGVGTVKVIKNGALETSLLVEAEKDCVLFSSDTWYPGWKAYVDGQEEEIKKANPRFREVAIKKGRYKVDFFHRPLSFLIGSIVSIATILFLVIFSVLNKRRLSREQ